MIQNAQVTPILPVVDLTRATGFYRDRLGLKDLGDEAGNHLLETGAGAKIGLMEAEPGAQSAHTVLTFEVVVRRLRGEHPVPARACDRRHGPLTRKHHL